MTARVHEIVGELPTKPHIMPAAQRAPRRVNWELWAGATHQSLNTNELHCLYNYAHLVGAVNYLCTTIRPDICNAISKLSQTLHTPTPEQAKHLYHLLRYLHSTADKTLEIKPTQDTGMIIYSDSNFADPSDKRRRSTSGTYVTLHGRPIAWRSKLQTCTADSTHEAELYALHQSLKVGLGLKYTLTELGLIKRNCTNTIFVDNEATTHTSLLRDQISNKNRHIDTRYFKICDHVESKDFTVTWVSGKYNPADIFTKPLAPAAFISHFDFIFENIPYYNELEGGTHAYSGP